jgi:hypothetical protein
MATSTATSFTEIVYQLSTKAAMKTLTTRLLDEVDSVNRQLRDIKAYIKTPFVKNLIRSLEYLATKHDLYSDVYMHPGSLHITMVARQLEGLKDEKLASLLNSVIHHEPETTSNSDYATSYTREYRFSWTDKTVDSSAIVRVTVTANFKEDSETCRRVITGYHAPNLEPTPIYALRCDDEGEATPAPDEAFAATAAAPLGD